MCHVVGESVCHVVCYVLPTETECPKDVWKCCFFFLFLSFSTGLGFSFLFFLVGREGTFLLGSQQEVDPPLSFSPLCSILLDLQQVTWAYRLHREVDLYVFQSR